MMQARPEGETVVGAATTAFRRFQAGDRAAFDTLVERATPLLWRTVRDAGVDTSTSEDVIQTVWVSLLRNSASVRDPQTVVKWLLTSARREAWRVRQRERTDSRRAVAVGVDGEEITAGLPDRREPPPDDAFLRDTRQRQLWGYVHQLPPRCRQLIGVIAFADRPDYAHLAECLGMPVGSIGPTRGRCLAKLRGLLAHDPLWEGQLS